MIDEGLFESEFGKIETATDRRVWVAKKIGFYRGLGLGRAEVAALREECERLRARHKLLLNAIQKACQDDMNWGDCVDTLAEAWDRDDALKKEE